MNPTENGIPTDYNRQFTTDWSKRWPQHYLAGRGKDPFENYDNVCFIQDIVTAHRSVTNMGVQR